MPKRRNDLPRVFTVGYAALAPAELWALVLALNVALIDVRSRPSGRVKRGFALVDLRKLLDERYEHRSDLGGFGAGPTAEGLVRLAADPRRMLLMCSEESPGDCHRHGIGLALAARGVTVYHIFRTEVVTAAELQRAIDCDDEYAFRNLTEVIVEADRVITGEGGVST